MSDAPAAVAPAADAPADRAAEIRHLIAELDALQQTLLAADARFAAGHMPIHPDFVDSARNLIHYLALRRDDVRALQERLAALGLSSLGRAESHVLSSVETVLAVLRELAHEPARAPLAVPRGTIDIARGRALLNHHTATLMGPQPAQRRVHIMVTMPSEAAHDYALVERLVQQGMDCMRINCAHDDAAAWARMIGHLRQAEQSLQRRCKVLMDLAGPKLRTGPLSPGPAVLKVRPTRDVFGRVVAPARLWLTPQECPQPPPAAAAACLPLPQAWLESLAVGERLDFRDARDARRRLEITEISAAGCWAQSSKSVYFVPGTQLRHGHHAAAVGALPPRENPLVLHQNDLLILRRSDEPGRAATVDAQGAMLAPATIGCIPAQAFREVRAGERIWFDDGKIGGIVEYTNDDGIGVRITHARPDGSKLRAEKGINLPDSRLSLPAMTAKDITDLQFVARHADMVALSFANCADDVKLLHRHLMQQQCGTPAIVLKIETRRGFENLPEMLLAAMTAPSCGVMIARGDLAVECGFERMAEVQEEILWICESAHVPAIWATQVLESLTQDGLPSRAEITDAAMGDRAECVMLNKGPNIAAAVGALDDILRRMQAHQSKKSPTLRALHLARAFTSPGAPAASTRSATPADHAPTPISDARPSGQVRFCHCQHLDAPSQAVVFLAFWNRQMIWCGVAADALVGHFAADARDPLPTVARHRDAIERLAEQLILQGRREADGSVLVRAEDCAWLNHASTAPGPAPAA